MGKRKWLVIPLILAILSAAIMGGMALAQDGDTDPSPKKLSLHDRVAELLSVTPEELENAFKQAASEARAAKIENHLQGLVDKGLIDQDQADEYKEWLDNMPEGFKLPLTGHGFGNFEFRLPRFKGFDDHRFGNFEFRFPRFKGFDDHRFDIPEFGGKDFRKWFRDGPFHPRSHSDGA